jgi:hypothetical protein
MIGFDFKSYFRRFLNTLMICLVFCRICLSELAPISGKSKERKELIKNLDVLYEFIVDTYNVSKGDFPDVNDFKAKLEKADWSKFQKIEEDQVGFVMNTNIERKFSVHIDLLVEEIQLSTERGDGQATGPPSVGDQESRGAG